MREIKFRAYHSANKIMYYHKNLAVLAKNIKDDNIWSYMQYTGLKDKNGVEIYEGDFVKKPGESGAPYQVIWQNGGFRGVSSDGDQYGPYTLKLYVNDSNPELVVIGNIHQNKELLKSDK